MPNQGFKMLIGVISFTVCWLFGRKSTDGWLMTHCAWTHDIWYTHVPELWMKKKDVHSDYCNNGKLCIITLNVRRLYFLFWLLHWLYAITTDPMKQQSEKKTEIFAFRVMMQCSPLWMMLDHALYLWLSQVDEGEKTHRIACKKQLALYLMRSIQWTHTQ